MAEDSTTEDANSAKDDFDLSTEDNKDDSQTTSTDDKQTDDTKTADDDLTSKKDSAKVDDKAPAFDADLEDWAEKTGHDKPENDRERKLLQDLRNSRRDYTAERQAKKAAQDLQKTVAKATPKVEDDDAAADPLEKDVKQLRAELNQERTTRIQSEYFTENGVTAEEVEVMGEILKEKADKGDMRAFEYLSDARNLGDLHDLVKIRMSKAETTDVVEKAKQEERERLAKLSKSGTTTRSAKATTSATKKDELAELWSSDD